jgi:hypothetical protein
MLLLCLPPPAFSASPIKAGGNSSRNSEASPGEENLSSTGGRETVGHACNPRIAAALAISKDFIRISSLQLQKSKTMRHYDAIPPDANEAGWKDTVRAEPGMATRILVRFEGYSGRYVWHCHILEHEDNEMMRPYDVLPG